jgi:hypothetical protein
MSNLNLNLLGKDYSASEASVNLRALLGGLLSTDWRQALIARGFGWRFNVGSFATQTDTGITGGGNGTVMDADQPEFVISVPTNYTLVPVEFNVQVRPGLQTTDSHVSDILIGVDRSAAWAGDGTSTSVTPINMRTNATSGCSCPCAQAFTADMTDPAAAGWQELARATKLTDVQGTAATVNLMDLNLKYAPDPAPFIVGPAMVVGYWGGSIAVVGFAQLSFIAIPSNLITGLV